MSLRLGDVLSPRKSKGYVVLALRERIFTLFEIDYPEV